ncbi:MAG: hypothetical protein ACI8WB_000051 [Phenylobacterium sp.]
MVTLFVPTRDLIAIDKPLINVKYDLDQASLHINTGNMLKDKVKKSRYFYQTDLMTAHHLS